MQLDLSDPAVLFPSVSLLLLAYTNRYLALARIVREIVEHYHAHEAETQKRQIAGLRRRLTLIKYMQAFGVVSLMMCLSSMLCLFLQWHAMGETFFALALAAMFLSLSLCLWETLISCNALSVLLSRYLPMEDDENAR